MRRYGALLIGAATLLALVAGGATAALRGAANPVLSTLSVGQGIGSGGIVVSPATGRAFIATATFSASGPAASHVMLLDVRTGTLLRGLTAGGSLPLLALDAPHGHVLVAVQSLTASSGRVMLLDARSGALLRTAVVGTAPLALAVDTRTNRAFVTSGGGSGCVQLPLACHRDPTVVSVLDTRTLRLLRTVEVGYFPHDIAVDERGGRVFVTEVDGIAVLDAATGRLLRTIDGVTSVLAVDRRNGHIVVAAGGGLVRVLDASGRHILHSVDLGGALVETAGVDEPAGRLWIAGIASFPALGGRVSVLDMRTGQVLHTIAVGRLPDAVAVDARSRRAYVLNQVDSSLSVIDMRRWRVVRTVPVGLSPTAIAVDGATGRVIVGAMQTPASHNRDPWGWTPAWLRRWLPFLPAPAAPSRPLPGGVTILNPAAT